MEKRTTDKRMNLKGVSSGGPRGRACIMKKILPWVMAVLLLTGCGASEPSLPPAQSGESTVPQTSSDASGDTLQQEAVPAVADFSTGLSGFGADSRSAGAENRMAFRWLGRGFRQGGVSRYLDFPFTCAGEGEKGGTKAWRIACHFCWKLSRGRQPWAAFFSPAADRCWR